VEDRDHNLCPFFFEILAGLVSVEEMDEKIGHLRGASTWQNRYIYVILEVSVSNPARRQWRV
jgi:hypothetical protein